MADIGLQPLDVAQLTIVGAVTVIAMWLVTFALLYILRKQYMAQKARAEAEQAAKEQARLFTELARKLEDLTQLSKEQARKSEDQARKIEELARGADEQARTYRPAISGLYDKQAHLEHELKVQRDQYEALRKQAQQDHDEVVTLKARLNSGPIGPLNINSSDRSPQ